MMPPIPGGVTPSLPPMPPPPMPTPPIPGPVIGKSLPLAALRAAAGPIKKAAPKKKAGAPPKRQSAASERKETPAQERRESPKQQAAERKAGTERPIKKKGK